MTSTHTIHVQTAPSYPVVIGTGNLGDILQQSLGDRSFLITDTHVRDLYGNRFKAPEQFVLPAGERHKTLASLADCLGAMADAGIRRDGLIVALGGGVVGDLAGLAAALWMRGVQWIQVPTTLLAMVDSSVGGKTAVDLPQGKNLVGAFHQPERVLIDVSVLKTLPAREFKAGMAEVVKYAALFSHADNDFMAWLETHAEAILAQHPETLVEMISHCIAYKAQVVADDPFDHGQRALLNLGHTFAHAIESESNFEILHGEAVAIGLVKAAALSSQINAAPQADRQRLEHLLQRFGLETSISGDLQPERLLQRMQLDKKADQTGLQLILWEGLGRPLQMRVGPSAILQALQAH